MQERIRRQYNRISQQKKNQLIQLVFKEALQIKEAAQSLGLNYAAAKTIISLYKKKKRQQILKVNNGKRCGIKKKAHSSQTILLISCIYGEVVSKIQM